MLYYAICEISQIYGVPAALLYGIVMAESSGNPWAMRYEDHYRWLYNPEDYTDHQSLDTEKTLQKTSLGLCIGKGEKVLTKSGFKNIENLKVGDYIINKHGKFDKITALTQPRSAECLEVKIGLNLSLNLTPDHKVLGKKSKIEEWKSTGKRKIVKSDELEWIKAKDLEEWDFVAYPKKFPVIDKDTIKSEDYLYYEDPNKPRLAFEYVNKDDYRILRYKGGTVKGKIYKKIKVDKHLMELIGFYLAEGNKADQEKGVVFSFHEDETEYIKRVIKLTNKVFGYDHNFYINHNTKNHCKQVTIYGLGPRMLGRIIKGKAKTKKIPDWILWLPPDKLKWLFKGAFCGDGCYKFAHYTTSSTNLAYDIAFILNRLNINSRITKVKNKGHMWHNVQIPSYQGIEKVNKLFDEDLCNQFTLVEEERQRRNKTDWHTDEKYIYYPVRSIKNAGEMKVYDVQVENESSFVVNRSIVHNCQIMGANIRKMGFDKPFLTQALEPYTNLSYGAMFIKRLYNRYDSWEDAVSAYNQGSPRKQDGEYTNQKYVDRVFKFSEAWSKPKLYTKEHIKWILYRLFGKYLMSNISWPLDWH